MPLISKALAPDGIFRYGQVTGFAGSLNERSRQPDSYMNSYRDYRRYAAIPSCVQCYLNY
jgi:hypothetical protein